MAPTSLCRVSHRIEFRKITQEAKGSLPYAYD
jgi:hypothetical protein